MNDGFIIIQHDGITITKTTKPAEKPDPSTLVFGCTFTDHMLTASWSEADGWEAPTIRPVENLSLHPAIPALHYATEVCIALNISHHQIKACLNYKPGILSS